MILNILEPQIVSICKQGIKRLKFYVIYHIFNFILKFGRSDIALIYNDRAVLENYHVSATFRLMKNDSYNILQELTRDEFKYDFKNN